MLITATMNRLNAAIKCRWSLVKSNIKISDKQINNVGVGLHLHIHNEGVLKVPRRFDCIYLFQRGSFFCEVPGTTMRTPPVRDKPTQAGSASGLGWAGLGWVA